MDVRLSLASFLGHEQAHLINMLGMLSQEMPLLRDLESILTDLSSASTPLPPEQIAFKTCKSLLHQKFYMSTSVFLRGHFVDSLSMVRVAIEATINAYLMDRGVLSEEAWRAGGARVMDAYRATQNLEDSRYLPELKLLFEGRGVINRYAAHAEQSVTKYKTGSDDGYWGFSFFDALTDQGYKFFFLHNLDWFSMCIDLFITMTEGRGFSVAELERQNLEVREQIQARLGE